MGHVAHRIGGRVMAGQRLNIGEHGDISYRERPDGAVTASFYYRNNRGVRRRIEATAGSKAAARRLALKKLEEALASGGIGEYSTRTKFSEVAEQWYAQMRELVEAGRRSPTTLRLYRLTLDNYVLPGIGELRLSELSTARMDHFIHDTRRTAGYATAKACRSVTSGVCGFAVRRDAMRTNPVRDISPLEADDSEAVRSLSRDELREFLELVDGSEYARRKDLPDMVRFLLGTGCRLGECLGMCWEDVNLDERVVDVKRTVSRVPELGLVARRPKSRYSERTIRIPGWLVDLLRERQAEAGPIFPDARGGFRDRENVEGAFRELRQGTAYEWVVPHTFRKTVATQLDEAGLSARAIADQLGHSRVSMTQDVYLGRRVASEAAASALEAAWEDEDDDEDGAA